MGDATGFDGGDPCTLTSTTSVSSNLLWAPTAFTVQHGASLIHLCHALSFSSPSSHHSSIDDSALIDSPLDRRVDLKCASLSYPHFVDPSDETRPEIP